MGFSGPCLIGEESRKETQGQQRNLVLWWFICGGYTVTKRGANRRLSPEPSFPFDCDRQQNVNMDGGLRSSVDPRKRKH